MQIIKVLTKKEAAKLQPLFKFNLRLLGLFRQPLFIYPLNKHHPSFEKHISFTKTPSKIIDY
jgi:hypothetical protein